MNECGLDPGIDHMSAMEIIHKIHEKGGVISKFHSYCGGLVADADDDNPFRYKISWNPKNVVLAGKGTARYIQNSRNSLLPYHRLFSSAEEIEVNGWGLFEAYPNRDSVPYAEIYGIPTVANLKRGTLRKSGFCKRWNAFVQLGMTDDDTILQFPEGSSYFDFIVVFLPEFLKTGFAALEFFTGDSEIAMDLFKMGFDPENPMILKRKIGTSADFLLDLIVENWRLKTNDKDLVVMVHEFEYSLDGFDYQLIASLGLEGKNASNTAMAQTVGLPLGICAKLLLNNQIAQKGLLLPLRKEIYKPILKELSEYGLHFKEVATRL
jgi:saccharopine dehydrogenase (NADP+, L-glutamate forming)